MLKIRSWAGALVVIAGSVGCDQAPSEPLSPCTSPISATVSGGVRPTITWSPNCAIAELVVLSGPGLQAREPVYWHIRSDAATIAPGLRYGQLPAGAREIVGAIPIDETWYYGILLLGSGSPPLVLWQGSWSP